MNAGDTESKWETIKVEPGELQIVAGEPLDDMEEAGDCDSVQLIAERFDVLLRREVGQQNYRRIIRENLASDNPSVCASHDYCDANVVMHHAYTDLIGHNYPERQDELMNAAWDRWRKETTAICVRPRFRDWR